MANNLQVLILAAGKGTRMNSDVPKVLHAVLGIAMIDHVIMKAKLLRPSKISIMINRDLLHLKKKYSNIHFLLQEPQLGTGHAVQVFQKQNKSKNTKLLILYGDNPLIDLGELKKIKLQLRNNDLTILGFNCHDNYSYGIIIEKNRVVDEIVEFKDANKEQRKITICNSGVMALGSKALNLVNKIQNNNIKKEFYLTDIVKLSKKYNHRIKLVTAKDSKAALGINDMYELGVAENIMQDQLRKKVMQQGVRLIAPQTVFLSKDTKFGKNVTIEPYVVIGPNVKIGNGSVVKSFSHIEGATIKNNVVIGPYARIRPGTVLEEGSKVGNFVEIKKSKINKNSKINHLSYIGDTTMGTRVNIGAGTITCNYDGKKKYKTIIKDKSFIGSNSSLVAPVTIGSNSIIGAGSVITKRVENSTLALTRSEQKKIKLINRKK
jgi:bifunctional UDP-N-acetylglucosamine pyrophosphorylase/glucosamine-1-phosphate N-acetyltransferase